MDTVRPRISRSAKLKHFPHDRTVRLLRQVARLDHSVSVPTIGSVFRFEPDSPIGKAQAHAAEIYGVPFAYPSTNGTTSLNVMALLSLANPGDTVLVQRDSHVSVLAPIIHAGLHPIYVTPHYSQKLGVTMGVTVDELRAELDRHPEVREVFLTYPNYFGIATDIASLAQLTADRKVPLIVDSAHGAHWVFHPDFPRRAEQAGAEIVTYSTHKTCRALGQGSLALLNDESLIPRLYEVVNNLGFVSTSFSTVILTALFSELDSLHKNGKSLLGERLAMAEWARHEINKIDGLHSFGLEESQPGFLNLDPLRLTVDVSGLGITGYQVEEFLIKNHSYYAEMCTLQNVLFLVTFGISWIEIKRLVKLLQQISSVQQNPRRFPSLAQPALPGQVLSPRDAFYCRKRRKVSVQEAIGHVSAESISAYPPGSAVIVVGEEVSEEIVVYLKAIQAFGGRLKGASDASFNNMEILEL